MSAVALVLVLVACSWPFTFGSIVAGSGLDSSWMLGLNLALAHGLRFGQQLIFPYGPLGLTMNPQVVTGGTFLLGMLADLVVQAVLVAVLLRCLRRTMGLLTAALLTLIGTSLISSIQADLLVAIAFGAVSLALTGDRRQADHHARVLALGGALLSAFAILVKLNDGVAVAAIVIVGLMALAHPRRHLAIAAAGGLVALTSLWLALGQPLAALGDYLRNGWEVVRGYVDAMGLNRDGPGTQWQLLLLVASGAALAVAAWTALPTLERRRRLGLSVAVLLPHYFLLREIFVRHDATRGAYFALLVVVALMVPWPAGRRTTGVAIASALAIGMFASYPKPPTQLVNPLGSAKAMLSDFHGALSGGRRAPIFALERRIIGEQDTLPPGVLAAVRGHCVTVEPAEISVVWLYGLRWCPLPALQSYNAYTSRLDRLDAAAYADVPHGPDRVLRQYDSIDGRNPTWESPAAMLSLLCHFGEVARGGAWEALARVPDRCGAPRPLAVIHSSIGRTITLPPPAAGSVLVASVDGLQVKGLERLKTLLTRAAVRTVSVDGRPFRVPPDTAADGLVVGVPAAADYAPPFNFDMAPRTLRATVAGHSSGPITVRLSLVPISPSDLGAAQVAAPLGSQEFRADVQRLPWLYEGRRLLAPARIASLSEPERELADSALLEAERLPLEHPGARALRTAVPAPIAHFRGLVIERTPLSGTRSGCTLLTPSTSSGAAVISVLPGHGLYLSMKATGQVSIYVRRFSDHVPPLPLHVLSSAGTPALLAFPPDASGLPWHVRLVPTTPTAACLVRDRAI